MRLEGSCHCGALRFALESKHPYPFNLCYCSICRKISSIERGTIPREALFCSLKPPMVYVLPVPV